MPDRQFRSTRSVRPRAQRDQWPCIIPPQAWLGLARSPLFTMSRNRPPMTVAKLPKPRAGANGVSYEDYSEPRCPVTCKAASADDVRVDATLALLTAKTPI